MNTYRRIKEGEFTYDDSKSPEANASKQIGGNHYSDKPIEPWKYITANKLDYYEGNVLKYVTRHHTKNGIQDIEKAIHYLTYMRDNYELLYGPTMVTVKMRQEHYTMTGCMVEDSEILREYNTNKLLEEKKD
jgi:hypothetical protein